VLELLNKGAIVETQQTPHNFVSQLFLVEKKDGGQRPVINLRSLNQFVKTKHFEVFTYSQTQDWMVKMDLKDIYLQIPIHPDYQHLLTLGENLQIPMPALWSLSSTQGVHQAEASGGFPETTYCNAPGEGSAGTNHTANQSIVREFGANGEQEEVYTDPNPETGISGLSPVLNDDETISSLQETSTGCQENVTSGIGFSEGNSTVCGQDNSNPESYPTNPIALQNPQMQMNSVLPLSYNQEEISDKYNTVLPLNTASKEDLRWWETLPTTSTGAPIQPPDPSIIVHPDASKQGWGAVLNGQFHTRGIWSPEEAAQHINYLELLAALLAIKAFGKSWLNITVLLRMDNVTAVSYINQKGGTVSKGRSQLAITIWT